MEAASENPGNQKRGRPAVFSPECVSLVSGLFPDIKTTRGRIDRCYALQAIEVLSKEPGLEWLWGSCALEESERGGAKLRFTVLTELGRIDDPQQMKAVAAVICGLKLRIRKRLPKLRTTAEPCGCLQVFEKP
jgi:hypothetical protein